MTRMILAALAAAALLPHPALAQATAKQPTFEVFGFAQVDYIQDFKRVDPSWNAMLRATKVPTVDGGSDGEAILSARQSRLGVKGSFPAGQYDLKARLEFDFFGRTSSGGNPDSAGQNTIRLRRAYGEWGPVLGGLTDSLFMDDDYWPNIVEYWGPTGMVFFRNVQLRYTLPVPGAPSVAVAIERPGADVQGYPNEAPDLKGKNTLPDLTARYRLGGQRWGYVQVSGILRRLSWENGARSGHVAGWGINVSSTIKLIPDKVHLLPAVVYGAGCENYMNDATPDVAASGTAANPSAKAVPLLGISAFLDVYWNQLLSSSVGYSLVDLDNPSLERQLNPGAYHRGEYASVNVLAHPAPNFLIGPELQWARRTDAGDANGEDIRLQISAKFSFSTTKDFWK